jgi:tRNA-binding EMAP/Myf-like protein
MYAAYITTIKELHKHPNADRLMVTTIFGNNVIVDLSYHEGQRVIYFPTDGQLSEEFATDNNLVKKYVPVSELTEEQIGSKQVIQKDGIAVVNMGGYMDANKRNIMAIKLRGEKSDGLVLPIEVLSRYGDISNLKDGIAIIEFCGHEICTKYIPKKKRVSEHKRSINKKEERETIGYPLFVQHIDTEQLAYNEKAFKEGDTIYLTRKLHGTSFRVANTLEVTTKKRNPVMKKIFRLKDKKTKKWAMISGTRRTTLIDYGGGYYGSNAFRKKYTDMFDGILPKGMEVFGEIVGWVDENTPIMPSCSNSKIKDKEFSKRYGEQTVFTYGCPKGENDCYIYRITMTNEDGISVELPTEEVMMWCERLGVKYVPLLEKFIYTTWDDLNERVEKYLDIPEPLANGSHIVEGVVVRIDNRSGFTAYKAKGFNFKVLEGIIKDTSDAPDIEEAEELVQNDAV